MSDINEQYPDRIGMVTASKCSDFMTKGKGEPFGQTAKTYALELALARIGYEPENITSKAMEWGIEHEHDARVKYEEARGVKCGLPGFIPMKKYKAGCTPDGVVPGGGLLEIKCQQWKAHAETLLSGQPQKHYWQQMQFQMMVTGAAWCDFMIFHPDFPTGLKFKVIRIERDQNYIDTILERLPLFEELINEISNKLN